MAMLKCRSCGGEYDPVQRDGSQYYHACPSITRVTVTRAGAATVVDLVAVTPDDEIQVRRGDAVVTVRADALEAGDVRIGDSAAPRQNARDENVTGPAARPGAPAPIKAPGAGTEPAGR